MSTRKSLTHKQEVFVFEYLRCWNATESARVAGYAHPHVQGSQTLAKLNVQEVIQARIAEKAMTADEVLIALAEHARGSLKDVLVFRTVRNVSTVMKPLAEVIDELRAEMLFEEEFSARAGLDDSERKTLAATMAALKRRILRLEMRLARDPDATEETAGPVAEEEVPVVDLAAALRRGKLHLVKSYNAKDGKVELYDAQAALVHIGKHHGLFKEVLDVRFNPAELSEEQLERIAAGEDPKKVIGGG